MQAKKTILLVSNSFSVGPTYGGVCKDLAEKLTQNNWQVVTTSSVSNRYLRPVDMLMTIWLARNRYEVAQIDVFSGSAFRWAELTVWGLRKLKKPYVLTLHGGNLPEFAARHPDRVRRLLYSANLVTTPSSSIRAKFADIRDDIIVLKNAIDLSAYKFECRSQPRPKLAWLRAFHAIYSPVTAAKVIALLADEFPEIELAMFGPDKRDGSLDEMFSFLRKSQIARQVQVFGAIMKTEVPSRLAPYSIFLNTTAIESFGVSVMEAAALGMCIVTTNVGELPLIWTHEQDALLVPPNDPQAMADAIRRVLIEPGLAEKLSRNARAKAEEFDWALVLPQWEKLLTEIARRQF